MEYSLDTRSGVPFYRQIVQQVKLAIGGGGLRPGEQLPTVRQLAVDLSVNPNTVVRAYRELEYEGLIDTQQGSGTFVADAPCEVDAVERQRQLDQILDEMLSRAASYGFTPREVREELMRRKEGS